ncbi:MAG: hypothetical protein JXA82_04860 [Sedimentisphaerales bacterium]|nr:hypothetical protein [Sedimentisphaerales bacterium]
MNLPLSDFEKILLTMLQDPLPICRHPFAEVGIRLDVDELTIIETIQDLKKRGLIRRFRSQLNYRTLGRTAVLVAVSVPEDKLLEIVERINAEPGVSHNYLRDHEYNVWFTLQGWNDEEIEKKLTELDRRCGVNFHPMPATKLFKLDVRFRLTGKAPIAASIPTDSLTPGDIELSLLEKKILPRLQDEFPIVSEPFDEIAGKDLSVVEVIETIHALTEKGVLRRIAAVLNYHKLGYTANLIFCAKVDSQRVDSVGQALAAVPQVSHCYERKTFPGFEYNLFGMMHARSQGEIRNAVQRFTTTHGIAEYALLGTRQELKKQPVRIITEP